jgi:hypothetical protein
MKDVSVIEAVAVLNRALEKDPFAMNALINHRVPCGIDLAKDETVQVGHPDDLVGLGFEVGMLGIINGIFGVRPNKCGYIAAVCEVVDGIDIARKFIVLGDDDVPINGN